jgi:hypothetical protein
VRFYDFIGSNYWDLCGNCVGGVELTFRMQIFLTIQLALTRRNWSVRTNHACLKKKNAPRKFSLFIDELLYKLLFKYFFHRIFQSSLGELSCRIQTRGYEIAGNFLRPLVFVF